MDKVTAERITRMQKSLSTLRKVAGWSAEEFAKELDVTRQTVVNLESGKTEMTKVQYMAIRLLFAAEIQEKSNETLNKAMQILVDRSDITEAERALLRKDVDKAVSSVSRRLGSEAASKAAIGALNASALFCMPGAAVPAVILGAAAAVASLLEMFKGTKE